MQDLRNLYNRIKVFKCLIMKIINRIKFMRLLLPRIHMTNSIDIFNDRELEMEKQNNLKDNYKYYINILGFKTVLFFIFTSLL